MSNLLQKIGSAIVSVGLAITSLLGINHSSNAPQAPVLGSAAPQFVAAKPTFLFGGGIASTDVSIKLTNLVTPNGTPITTAQLVGGPSGVFYATIEPATTKKETVSCTAVTQNGDGTALMTGCTRGLQFTTPYTASTTLALAHAGGSSVVISNSPQVYNDIVNDAVSLTRSSTVTGQVTFSSTTPPQYDVNPVFGNFASTTFASLSYVNGVATSGSPNASETIKGISQLATALQASNGTASGSSGARLVLPASIATSTCQVATSTVLIASSTTGKLNPPCFDATGSYSFSGSNTFLGTTTISASGTIPLILNGATTKWPSANGASSTALLNDGSGNLSWGTPGAYANGTFSTSTVASGNIITLAYPNIGSAPRLITIDGSARAANTNISISWFHGSATSTATGVGANGTYVTGGTNSTTGNWGPSTTLFQWGDNSGNNGGAYTISSISSTSTILTTSSPGVITNLTLTWSAFK